MPARSRAKFLPFFAVCCATIASWWRRSGSLNHSVLGSIPRRRTSFSRTSPLRGDARRAASLTRGHRGSGRPAAACAGREPPCGSAHPRRNSPGWPETSSIRSRIAFATSMSHRSLGGLRNDTCQPGGSAENHVRTPSISSPSSISLDTCPPRHPRVRELLCRKSEVLVPDAPNDEPDRQGILVVPRIDWTTHSHHP